MSQVLIVSGSDFSEQVYKSLAQLAEEGVNFVLLSDGTFEPSGGFFQQHYRCNLSDTSETLIFMKEQAESFDSVVTKSSEWLVPLTSLLSQYYGTKGPSPETALLCRSKLHMRSAFAKAGLPVPRFRRCQTFENIQSAVEDFGVPCVVKPIAADASVGTFLLRPQDNMEWARDIYAQTIDYLNSYYGVLNFSDQEKAVLSLEESLDLKFDFLVEEYMVGTQVSIDALVQNGTVYPLGIAHQIRMGSPYFVQIEESMPFECSVETLRDIFQLVAAGIAAVKADNCATHTEVIITETGPRLLEIACRIGGDNIHDSIYQTTGCSLFAELIRISLGQQRSFEYNPSCAVAMKYLLAARPGILTRIQVAETLRQDTRVTELVTSDRIGQKVGAPPTDFDHLGYIQVRGSTVSEAKRSLTELAAGIEIGIKSC